MRGLLKRIMGKCDFEYVRNIQMASKHMKRGSISLIIRETQVKTTRDHLLPVRMATIKKPTNNKCWRGCEEKGNLQYSWWECKFIEPL